MVHSDAPCRRGNRHHIAGWASPPQCRHVRGRTQSRPACCSAVVTRAEDQRVAGGAESTGAVSAGGAPAEGGGAALRRFTVLRAGRFVGLVAGCSSATTGLGSIVVVAAVKKSPPVFVTWTGTVVGIYLSSIKLTLKLPSAVTGTEQGVLQLGPSEVRASAPGGTESSCTVTGVGAGFNESSDNEEQPAKPRLAAAITNTRRMGHPPLLMRLTAAVPA
jgi:hypothetical protein